MKPQTLVWGECYTSGMHAYLVVGQKEDAKKEKANEIAGKHKAKIIEFPLIAVTDARNIEKFVKLKPTFKTALFLKNIDNASSETLNAFLKILEEKADYIFILTTKNRQTILPTIISRCQVINAQEHFDDEIGLTKVNDFYLATVSQKIEFLHELKTRPEALEFLDNILNYGPKMLENASPKLGIASFLQKTAKAKKRLSANTNVYLQLLNYVISLDQDTL